MRACLKVVLALALGIFSASASASPQLWTLSGVTFSDGGTASGSFVYDVNTNTYSSISISTTAGSVILSPASYAFLAPGLPATSGQALYATSSAANLTGTRGFALFFVPALTNGPGTRPLAGNGQEATCGDATCSFPSAPMRFVTAGALVSVANIPALSTWAMLATILLLVASAFFALRRLTS